MAVLHRVAEAGPGRGRVVPAGTDGSPQRSGLHPGLALALSIGVFVGMVDATVVAVALDPLRRHFAIGLPAAQAVLALYLAVVTAALPTLGRLGDRYGRRRLYLLGFAVFGIGSAAAALAPTFPALLGARAVQALGGGVLTAASLALMAEHAPRRGRGRGIALLVAVQAVAGLVGPPLGGALTSLFGWQAVFWAGVPLALGGSLAAVLWVPASSAPRELHLDGPGAAGLALLLVGIDGWLASLGGDQLVLPPLAWAVLAAVGAVVLVLVEPRASRPLVDPRLLGAPRFRAALVATLLSTGALMSCLALLPFWLMSARGFSAAAAGSCLVPVAVGIGATSRIAGRLADRGATRRSTTLGMAVAATGLLIAALAALLAAIPLLLLGLLVLGAGNGLFSSPNTAAAIGLAPIGVLGSAAGLLSTARNLGVVTGLGLTGAAWAATATGSAGAAGRTTAAILAIAAGVCLPVAAISWRCHTATPGRAVERAEGAPIA